MKKIVPVHSESVRLPVLEKMTEVKPNKESSTGTSTSTRMDHNMVNSQESYR